VNGSDWCKNKTKTELSMNCHQLCSWTS